MKQTLLTAPRDPTTQHQDLGKPARSHKHQGGNSSIKNWTPTTAPRGILVKPELRRDTKTKDKHLCVRGRLTVRLSESTARPSELPG